MHIEQKGLKPLQGRLRPTLDVGILSLPQTTGYMAVRDQSFFQTERECITYSYGRAHFYVENTHRLHHLQCFMTSRSKSSFTPYNLGHLNDKYS